MIDTQEKLEEEIERWKTEMAKELVVEIDSFSSLLEERADLEKKLSSFKKQISNFDHKIETLENELRSEKERIMGALEKGKDPETFSTARDKENKINDLNEWKDEVEDQIIRLRKALEKNSRAVAREWGAAFNRVMQKFRPQAKHLTFQLEAILRASNRAEKEVSGEYEISSGYAGSSLRAVNSQIIAEQMDAWTPENQRFE